MVTICCVFTALRWGSNRASALFPTPTSNSSPPLSYTVQVPPGVILYGSLVYKYIFLGLIPVDGTTSISYTEPLYCSQNLCCNELAVASGCVEVSPRVLFC